MPRDLFGLSALHLVLLGVTASVVGIDAGDIWMAVAWTVFLLPGWLLAPAWTATRSSFPRRYTHAVIGSLGMHAWLAWLTAAAGLGFDGYYVAFGLAVAGGFFFRWRRGPASRWESSRWPPLSELVVWLAVMVLVAAIFRLPRSADILQFSLQQQDMTAARSLQPSDIGMSGFGVDKPMPRWQAHLWHLVPSLLADATGLPVAGVLLRWAPIPVGFSVLASLIELVRGLAGRRVPLWAVVLAVFGPVLLWYRAYNAFNYSFRLTNNVLLDKDLALFLLIPAVVDLAARWFGASRRCGWGLVGLTPAILKFHPMTAVYLVGLAPFVLIAYGPRRHRAGPRRERTRGTVMGYVLYLAALMAATVVIGDAQTAHDQILAILRTDFAEAVGGRPLHYWPGHYAAIDGHGLPLDTTEWRDGRLWLRTRVLVDCGLLGAAHVAWLVWLLGVLARPNRRDARRLVASGVVLVMLWILWLVSPVVLSRFPHYLAGFERLHWFAYLPCLIAITRGATVGGQAVISIAWKLLGRPKRRSNDATPEVIGNVAIVVLLLYSGLTFAAGRTTFLTSIRGINSLLDYELQYQLDRWAGDRAAWYRQPPESLKPPYLRERDRVLFLEPNGNEHYWLIKRGIFWSEPYAEAFALQRRGDTFLEDRRFFYRLLDRVPVEGLRRWLDRRGVSLLIDLRPGGDEYLARLSREHDLAARRISPGVYRYETRTAGTDLP